MNIRIDFLDSLRGYAILGVLLVHTYMICPKIDNIWISSIIGDGARGVQLFYLVSAITLMYSLYYSHIGEQNHLLNYFIRRFFRIAPLYYCSIIFYLIFLGLGPRYWLGEEPTITFQNVISHLLFINGWNPNYINSIIGVEWSIAVEMTFYLCLPLIFLKVNDLKKSFLLFILSALGAFLSVRILSLIITSPPRLWSDFLYVWFPSQLPIFCLGIFLFFLIFKTNSISTIKKSLLKISPNFIIENEKSIALIILFISMIFYFACTIGNIQLFHNYLIFSIGSSLFILGLSIYSPRLLVNNYISYLGKISFSCYLMHMIIISLIGSNLMGIISNFIKNPILIFAITYLCVIAGTGLLSVLTYRYIESPGILFGKKIINSLKRDLSNS